MKVKNITDEQLGYSGYVIAGGRTIEVPEAMADAMVRSNPGKFAIVEAAPVSDRMMDTKAKRRSRK